MIEGSGGVLSGISKRFSRHGPWILDNVHLHIEPGTETVIVGGNGSGKSTLLRVAAGLTQPTTGLVKSPTTIGYVPERLAAGTRLTGSEYLGHMGRIKGLDDRTIEARSRELLERLDLQPGPDVPTSVLSKGNRQKLIIAQAFLSPVEMVILDEPRSGLDLPAQQTLGELIEAATTRGSSVMVSTHLAETCTGADHYFQIEHGRLAEIQDPGQSTDHLLGTAWHIELMASPGACSVAEIDDLAGVRSSRHHPLGSLSLIADKIHVDRILATAISWGWSVNAVGPVQEGKPPQ
jgi:ABC-2 type transport system ATP-binding protein